MRWKSIQRFEAVILSDGNDGGSRAWPTADALDLVRFHVNQCHELWCFYHGDLLIETYKNWHNICVCACQDKKIKGKNICTYLRRDFMRIDEHETGLEIWWLFFTFTPFLLDFCVWLSILSVFGVLWQFFIYGFYIVCLFSCLRLCLHQGFVRRLLLWFPKWGCTQSNVIDWKLKITVKF